MAENIPEYLKKPFRVCHTDGSVVEGFDDIGSAKVNATERNRLADKMGLSCRYVVRRKPA